MTPARLTTIGRALYGERWQSSLARVLGVSDRTVRRWVAGSSPVPDGVWGELRELMRARAGEIRGLLVP